ncbi:hypothetical protein [Nostocoides sp. HKS02]|uniref:hypothetical protein n=1 Tax=Nostocoides sp. HKS02 TaxID=1813880 RepID=UPI0012B45406|nr:hypothetical protein [Tetrasphaera sp. HKS02]QGN57924.1 hypothetical protein GKE56_08555 [Tetrasphaera sp. HKS02]
MTRLAQRSVTTQLKVLGVALLLLVPGVGVASMFTLVSQSRDIQALTLALGPAFDANNAALIDMTDANADWSQRVGGSTTSNDYRAKRLTVIAELDTLQKSIASPRAHRPGAPAVRRPDEQAAGRGRRVVHRRGAGRHPAGGQPTALPRRA